MKDLRPGKSLVGDLEREAQWHLNEAGAGALAVEAVVPEMAPTFLALRALGCLRLTHCKQTEMTMKQTKKDADASDLRR